MTPDETILTELVYMVKKEAARRRKEAMQATRDSAQMGDTRVEEVRIYI